MVPWPTPTQLDLHLPMETQWAWIRAMIGILKVTASHWLEVGGPLIPGGLDTLQAFMFIGCHFQMVKE